MVIDVVLCRLNSYCVLFIILVSSASAATLQVGSKLHYKTIQSAVDAAHNGDTITVMPGIYRECVLSTKNLQILGQKGKYPRVNGFQFYAGGTGTINGFAIYKDGVTLSEAGQTTVRNNKFYYGGVSVTGQSCSENTIMNNMFWRSGISLYETYNNKITGNTIDRANTGLALYEGASCTTITKNTFKNCKVGVQVPSIPSYPIENKYIKNKINIKIVPDY